MFCFLCLLYVIHCGAVHVHGGGGGGGGGGVPICAICVGMRVEKEVE